MLRNSDVIIETIATYIIPENNCSARISVKPSTVLSLKGVLFNGKSNQLCAELYESHIVTSYLSFRGKYSFEVSTCPSFT